MSGSQVTSLQRDLNTLGYLDVTPTGYYAVLQQQQLRSFREITDLKRTALRGLTLSRLSKG